MENHTPTDFDDTEIVLGPVGFVRSTNREPAIVADGQGIRLQGEIDSTARHMQEVKNRTSEIVIKKELADLLYGIDDYSHIMVLFWGHKIPEKSRTLKRVHPMGNPNIPMVGIYSTCSPARPNSVLLTVVRLLERNENILQVSGLDAVHGSPVLDIKPYVPDFFPREGVEISPWMADIIERFSDVLE